jgi:hypothetical protein
MIYECVFMLISKGSNQIVLHFQFIAILVSPLCVTVTIFSLSSHVDLINPSVILSIYDLDMRRVDILALPAITEPLSLLGIDAPPPVYLPFL